MTQWCGERCSRDLELLFNREFLGDFRTRLVGGAPEPYYSPGQGEEHHQLFYREDYFASALHEVAHWCIAGEARRRLPDFGYWYNPDGRDRHQQRVFEQVEVKPQAIEWIFSRAAGIPFNISVDNLCAEDPDAAAPSTEFARAVAHQASLYCRAGLPPRALRFSRVLQQFYGSADPMDPALYGAGPGH